MGIKHFFSWYRKAQGFKDTVTRATPREVNHVLIDMNGIIHEAAQQVFLYGKYAPQKNTIVLPRRTLLGRASSAPQPKRPTEEDLFACIKNEVNKILEICRPSDTLVLAIDGVAPKGKQNQQRQRRFRAKKESVPQTGTLQAETKPPFDSTCITAGTEFMKRLSESLYPLNWARVPESVDVLLSSDAVPGEGEHKLIDWIRKHEGSDDVFTVVGMDADLILLCMCLKKRNVAILRENERRDYDWIDIGRARDELTSRGVTPEDLVVWSCFIGNDFLPAVPTLEIKESPPYAGALDWFFEQVRAPLVKISSHLLRLNIDELVRLLSLKGEDELGIMNARARQERPEPLFGESESVWDQRRFPNTLWRGDIDLYYSMYFEQKLLYNASADTTRHEVARAFLKTVYWVVTYYTAGIRDWDWFYPYNYTLHAKELAEFIPDIVVYALDTQTKPSHPHEQLLRVIPPESKQFVPEYLWPALDGLNADYVFKVDPAGKRAMWEATTIVNFVHPAPQTLELIAAMARKQQHE
jgi:5'-3' exoribonuclease 1